MNVTETPLPAADHPSIYDEYEVLTLDGIVCFRGPLWAALMYLRLEESRRWRRLMPTKKGGA